MDRDAFYKRTMHTPDDPERAQLRAALSDVSKLLLPLHRSLIDAARDDYAFGYGPVEGPGHLLRLLNEDPFFAWLKPMTSLIVDIDELVRADFETAAVDDIRTRLDRLFGPNVDPEFSERYVPILQRDVDVAAGHAAVRKALPRLKM